MATLAAYLAGMPGLLPVMVPLFILTGCRSGEIESLKWGYVHLDAPGHLALPDSKTDAKIVPLGAPAVDLLRSIRPQQPKPDDWVFPSPRDSSMPYRGLASAWRRHRVSAGCAGYRRHDLRHAFGATATRLGASLRQVGGVLGHADVRTSAIYAHLNETDAARIANETSQRLADIMAKKSS